MTLRNLRQDWRDFKKQNSQVKDFRDAKMDVGPALEEFYTILQPLEKIYPLIMARAKTIEARLDKLDSEFKEVRKAIDAAIMAADTGEKRQFSNSEKQNMEFEPNKAYAGLQELRKMIEDDVDNAVREVHTIPDICKLKKTW